MTELLHLRIGGIGASVLCRVEGCVCSECFTSDFTDDVSLFLESRDACSARRALVDAIVRFGPRLRRAVMVDAVRKNVEKNGGDDACCCVTNPGVAAPPCFFHGDALKRPLLVRLRNASMVSTSWVSFGIHVPEASDGDDPELIRHRMRATVSGIGGLALRGLGPGRTCDAALVRLRDLFLPNPEVSDGLMVDRVELRGKNLLPEPRLARETSDGPNIVVPYVTDDEAIL